MTLEKVIIRQAIIIIMLETGSDRLNWRIEALHVSPATMMIYLPAIFAPLASPNYFFPPARSLHDTDDRRRRCCLLSPPPLPLFHIYPRNNNINRIATAAGIQ
jgi:hypothetical protein